MRTQIERLVRTGCTVSLVQLNVLFNLLDADRTVKELFELGGQKFGKPTVVRAVDSLAGRNYVRRKDHPVDRRQVIVYLTDAGRRFAAAALKP